MATFAVILPAAGTSSRFGDPKQKKIYADLDGRAVWLRALDAFLNRDDVAQIILAIHPEDRELFERRYRPSVAFLDIQVIDGGSERYETVAKALACLKPTIDHVAVHDAARPCLPHDLVSEVFAAAIAHGAAIPGVPVADTLKLVNAGGTIEKTIPRAGLYGVQTPQCFRRELLERAYANRQNVGSITDDAQLVEAIGHPCVVVPGSPFNLKITTAQDLVIAAALLPTIPQPKKDAPAHPFADERAMW